MNRRRNLMMRALENDALSADEHNELRALVAADPAAREEMMELHALAAAARAAARHSFGPGFADRVLERLARRVESRFPSFADMLAPLFYRVAGGALFLALAIGGYNVVASSGPDQTPIEAALGLPSVTVESAYESAFGSLAANTEPEMPENR